MATPKSNNLVPVLLFLVGGYVIFKQYFQDLTEDFQHNIGVTIKKVKVGFSGSLITVPFINFTIPSKIEFRAAVRVRNANPVGVSVNNFNGKITYGRDGAKLADLNNGGFPLPAMGKVETDFVASINILSLPGQIKELVALIQNGALKNVFITGRLNTNLGSVKINQDVGLVR